MITHLHKHIKILTYEQEQYKGVVRTLNQEVKDLREKLEEEGRQKKKEQEAKAMVEKKLTALLAQVETARADTTAEFKTTQSFIDSCASYYGDGFEDCLKQVKSLYPHLDLSKVTMDDPLPLTPVGDTIFLETDYSTESEEVLKDDNVILAQPAASPPIIPFIKSIVPLNTEDPLAQDVQDLPPKGDENPQDALASWTLASSFSFFIVAMFNALLSFGLLLVEISFYLWNFTSVACSICMLPVCVMDSSTFLLNNFLFVHFELVHLWPNKLYNEFVHFVD